MISSDISTCHKKAGIKQIINHLKKKMVRHTLDKILYWRSKRVSNNTFLILASVIVGLVSSIAALLLKISVHLLHFIPEYFKQMGTSNLWLFVFPITGILITILVVKFIFSDKLEKGLGRILYAISHKTSKIEISNTYSHIITSGITVGLGGSAGLEAPIAITGSAIGSNIAVLLNLGHKERALLLACGAASGIAAVFNSPIAGVIFALEVLLVDFSIPAFIPLLISTATATIVSKTLYSGQLFYLISNQWYFHAIPYYILLGVICGLLSAYMKKTTLFIEGYFHDKKYLFYKRLGGLILLGSLIFLIPPLFGDGYTSIEAILKGEYSKILDYSILKHLSNNAWILLLCTCGIIFFKVIASSLTIGIGGNGGIFAPSLYTGAFTGFGLSYFINTTGIANLNVSNFIVVGMAGILSGVVHAPLTAIFLIAEITGGYVLFVPLMIVSAMAYFITRIFEPHSVYTKKLAEMGYLLSNDKDENVLTSLKLEDLIEKNYVVLRPEDSLSNLISAFTESTKSVFPVVGINSELIGVVFLDKVKNLLFKEELYEKLKIGTLTEKIITIDINEKMNSVMVKFEQTNLWTIPVIENKKYIGFISRSNILTYYRRTLKKSNSLF